MRFKFEERRPDFFANSAYQATNEDIPTIRKLVEEVAPKRVASIASGGEIPLMVMLPQATDGVWAVDICYGGLAWTALKALLLEHLGAKGVIDLFKGGAKGVIPPARWHHFRDLLMELSGELPDILKSRVLINRDNSYNPFSAIYQLWDVETGRVDERLLATTIERLDTLTLVHGDIRDLAGLKADIYYTSNAITYGGAYDGKPINLDDLVPVLKQGGHVLATDNARYTPINAPHWQQLSQIPTPQGGYGTWTFYVFRYGRVWPKPLSQLNARIPGLRVGVLDEPMTSVSPKQTLRRSR